MIRVFGCYSEWEIVKRSEEEHWGSNTGAGSQSVRLSLSSLLALKGSLKSYKPSCLNDHRPLRCLRDCLHQITSLPLFPAPQTHSSSPTDPATEETISHVLHTTLSPVQYSWEGLRSLSNPEDFQSGAVKSIFTQNITSWFGTAVSRTLKVYREWIQASECCTTSALHLYSRRCRSRADHQRLISPH